MLVKSNTLKAPAISFSKNIVSSMNGLRGNSFLLAPEIKSEFEDLFENYLYTVETETAITVYAFDYRLDNQVFTKDVTIRCVNLYLEGKILLAGKNINIYAKSITCNNAVINSSGPVENTVIPKALSGMKPGEGGANGEDQHTKDGIDAGKIFIAAYEINGDLSLLADGGSGINGQNGGDGIDGRNGANGKDSKCPEHLYPGSRGENGQDGGPAGSGARGGNAGNGGDITIVIERDFSSKLTHSNEPGNFGLGGKVGRRGAGGKKGIGGASLKGGRYSEASGDYWDCKDNGRFPDGVDGNHGGEGTPGQNGKLGMAGKTEINQTNYFSHKIIDVAYADIVTTKVENLYIKEDFGSSLANCVWFLSFFQEVPDENIDISIRTYINRHLVIFQKLSLGLDFWGNVSNYVPLLTKEYIELQLTQAFEYFSDIEAYFKVYFNAQEDKEKRVLKLIECKKKSEDLIDLTKQKIAESQDFAIKLNEEIKELTYRIEALYQKFLESENKFREAIAKKSGCDFRKTLECIKMVVSIGKAVYGDVTAVISAVKNGVDVFTHSVSDKPIENFISKVEILSDNLGTIGEKVSDVKAQFNKLTTTFKDQNSLIELSKKDFEELLKDFKDLPEAQGLKNDFDNYVRTVSTRNEKKLVYTTAILEIIASVNEIKNLEYQIAIRDWEKTSLINVMDTVEVKQLMKNLYYNCKIFVLKLLYLEKKAYQYWAMDVSPKNAILIDENSTTLKAAHLEIKNIILQKMLERGKGADSVSKPSKSVEFTSKTHPLIFEALKANSDAGKNVVLINITPADPAFAAYWSEIIATSVEVYLNGIVSVRNRNIKMKLTHLGNSTFINQKGLELNFAHVSPRVSLTYDLSEKRFIEETKNNLVGSSVSSTEMFTGVSPFASWRLEIDNRDNDLKFDKLDKIEFKFSFLFRTPE